MQPPLDAFRLGHLAKIVESSDDAIVSKDLNGTIRSWNRAAEAIFGYTAEEAVGRSIRMIIPADRQGEEDEVLARVSRGEGVGHFETQRQRKDGTLIDISLTVSPVRDDQGTIIGASKIARDISERRRLQARRESSAASPRSSSEVGAAVVSSLDRGAIVQNVTDIATEADAGGVRRLLLQRDRPVRSVVHALHAVGAPMEAFARFPQPRATAVFAPTFHGEGRVRLDDVTTDPRYGRNPPYHGLPEGHLPVRSYLAVPGEEPAAARSSAGCSSAIRHRACSPSSTSDWPRASPPGLRSRSKTPGSMSRLGKRTG